MLEVSTLPATPSLSGVFYRLYGRARAALAEPVHAGSLVAFRVTLGALIALIAGRYLAYGWVDRFFIQPTYHFTYFGFGWVKPLPAAGMYVVFATLTALGLMISAGLFYRWAAIAAFVLFTYLELIDVATYINHYYLISVLALVAAMMPLQRTWSLDVRWRRQRAQDKLPAWCVWAVRTQMAIVYFYAGLAKLSSDWLLHGQPMGIWLHARVELPIVGALFDDGRVALLMSWAGFLFDLTIWAWLLWRRSRPWAYLVVVVFHIATYALFPMIGMFPLIMMTTALIFFPPSWPRSLALRFGRRSAESVEPRADESCVSAGLAKWTPRLVLGFLLLQALLPLRHYAYPGDVLWNEQGMRFAWKVMAREKNGSVTFFVRLVDQERTVIVSPSKYLADYQEREMSTQPDLILQLAHQIAEDYRRQGHARVEVRADAVVSLNGRPPARLIDSTVDLASVEDDLSPYDFVLPSPTTPPIGMRRAGERT